MNKLNLPLRRTSDPGLFHDSRKDVVMLMRVVNAIHDKVNELIDENESLKQEVSELKRSSPILINEEI